MRTFFILLVGFILKVGLTELGNISWTHRFGNCVIKMHQNIYPDLHPKGGHYCLTYMRLNPTLFETISLYSPDLYTIYDEKVVQPKLSQAYRESQKVNKK